MLRLELWDEREKIILLSSLAGVFLCGSWLLVIDSSFGDTNSTEFTIPAQMYLPGVASTFALLIIVFLDIRNFLASTIVDIL